MIEVVIRSGRKELAVIKLENVYAEPTGEKSDYSVKFAVDTGRGALAMYQRAIYAFPRKRLNVLALIRLALTTLEEKELSLDGDIDSSNSPDLGRELRRAVR